MQSRGEACRGVPQSFIYTPSHATFPAYTARSVSGLSGRCFEKQFAGIQRSRRPYSVWRLPNPSSPPPTVVWTVEKSCELFPPAVSDCHTRLRTRRILHLLLVIPSRGSLFSPQTHSAASTNRYPDESCVFSFYYSVVSHILIYIRLIGTRVPNISLTLSPPFNIIAHRHRIGST